MEKKLYTPSWESLDSHGCPEWFDKAKIGLFIHWGPYSSEKCDTHEFMVPEYLTADKYDPDEWINFALKAGCRYFTFTMKHGGGYAMYNSDYTKWGSMHSGPRRDLFKPFIEAARKNNMRVISYYCKPDIFSQESFYHMAIEDEGLFKHIIDQYEMHDIMENWTNYMSNQIKEIFQKYQPDGLWLDGTYPDYRDTKINETIAWIYNNYPETAINDRAGWFGQRKCHGDFYTMEREQLRLIHILPYKWEREVVLGTTCHYKQQNSLINMKSWQDLVWDMADTVSLEPSALGPIKIQ